VSAAPAQKSTEDADKTVASQNTDQSAEDEKKKKAAGEGPQLVRRVGRVTVLLPNG